MTLEHDRSIVNVAIWALADGVVLIHESPGAARCDGAAAYVCVHYNLDHVRVQIRDDSTETGVFRQCRAVTIQCHVPMDCARDWSPLLAGGNVVASCLHPRRGGLPATRAWLCVALAAVLLASSSLSSALSPLALPGALEHAKHAIVQGLGSTTGPAGVDMSGSDHDSVFRDFGAMRMYDAGDIYDPLVLPCMFKHGRADRIADAPCCGDGSCQQHCLASESAAECVGGYEQHSNCPQDCIPGTARRRQFELSIDEPQISSLFSTLATEVQHPEYHCHSADSSEWPSYDEPATQPRWFLGRPSVELAAFFKDQAKWVGTSVPILEPLAGLTALDLGCGDGRDTRFLRELGFRVTGVDISVPSIRRAIRAENDHQRHQTVDGATDILKAAFTAEYVLYDALQLPHPSRPIDLVYDNTIYCNLRLEYLTQVTDLLERLTHPGSLFFLNCGNANYPQIMHGHPRLKESSIRDELGGLFEVLAFREGVYDMDLQFTDDGTPVLDAWPELEWEVANQGAKPPTTLCAYAAVCSNFTQSTLPCCPGVHGWAVLMRRRNGGESTLDTEHMATCPLPGGN